MFLYTVVLESQGNRNARNAPAVYDEMGHIIDGNSFRIVAASFEDCVAYAQTAFAGRKIKAITLGHAVMVAPIRQAVQAA
jgi:hypothetical protein